MRTDQFKRAFIFLTNKCENNCIYCFMTSNISSNNFMTFESFEEICKILKEYLYKNITFIGGEPLLHPYVLSFINKAIDYGFDCSISTSGIRNDDDILLKIFDLPLDDITLSLDYSNKTINDLLRGENSYFKTIKSTELIIKKKIPLRFTCTITQYNIQDIFNLAKFVQEIGAFQLDIHLMSLKGRASHLESISVSPQDWYEYRMMLDDAKFAYPFNISYPIMWYKDYSEFDILNYCDAVECNRLSIMPDKRCYYCTLAIDSAYFNTIDNLNENKFNSQTKGDLCEIERTLGTISDNYHYICRFYKRKTKF